MKQIKCSKCDKFVMVEDSYPLKCCSICLTKLKSKRQLIQESKRFVKSMKFEFKIAKSMQNFHSYQKVMREYFHMKVDWDDYIRDLQRIKESQIYLKDKVEFLKMHEGLEPNMKDLIPEPLDMWHGHEETERIEAEKRRYEKENEGLNACQRLEKRVKEDNERVLKELGIPSKEFPTQLNQEQSESVMQQLILAQKKRNLEEGIDYTSEDLSQEPTE
ncbi:hypothetical protein MUP77_18035 [Candidatus Bathyarchaeota archaeon]|nr:hypothetical protein [Candidatus Bathyarchaeota archaeon]